jgi:hypothetical protein
VHILFLVEMQQQSGFLACKHQASKKCCCAARNDCIAHVYVRFTMLKNSVLYISKAEKYASRLMDSHVLHCSTPVFGTRITLLEQHLKVYELSVRRAFDACDCCLSIQGL